MPEPGNRGQTTELLQRYGLVAIVVLAAPLYVHQQKNARLVLTDVIYFVVPNILKCRIYPSPSTVPCTHSPLDR